MQTRLKQLLLTSLLVSGIFSAPEQSMAQSVSPPMAYVPNEKDGTVSVIDTQTDEVVKTLPAKGALGKKIQAAAVHPALQKLYVVVRDKNEVAVIKLQKVKQ